MAASVAGAEAAGRDGRGWTALHNACLAPAPRAAPCVKALLAGAPPARAPRTAQPAEGAAEHGKTAASAAAGAGGGGGGAAAGASFGSASCGASVLDAQCVTAQCVSARLATPARLGSASVLDAQDCDGWAPVHVAARYQQHQHTPVHVAARQQQQQQQ